MEMDDLNIILPGAAQSIVLEANALRVLVCARQLAKHDKETGGILLARISKSEVKIVEATRAERRASISRILFKPSLIRKRRIVNEAFEAGLHFVGEWHTHPERDPTPSNMDIDSMKDSFRRSRHELNRFIMVIVGNREEKLSLSITLHSEDGIVSLGGFQIDI